MNPKEINLETMIVDYKNKGERVDEVLFQEVMKVVERSNRLEYDRDMKAMQVIELGGELHSTLREKNKLKRENKQLREALGFYADDEIYEWETYNNPQQQMDCIAIDDGGHRARHVLGQSK